MELRLRPLAGGGQRVHAYRLDLTPQTRLGSYVDGFGNQVHYFNLLPPHAALDIVSQAEVETGLRAAPSPTAPPPVDLLVLRPPVLDTAAVRRLARRAGLTDRTSAEDVREALRRINELIAHELAYMADVTTVSTDVEEVLRLRRGVCQDFAHVFIAVTRSAGVPARYVSGYVYAGDGEPVVGASHAWAEAWVPGRGWAAYDPTHPGLTAEHYVRVAVGRDYRDAAPTRGVYVGSAGSAMEARVEIRPLPDGTAALLAEEAGG
jgi:transglutaminase-like putative cysteine protease